MSGSLNKVMLIGRLGQDPEIRNTQDGRSLCTFSLATSENWNDRNTGERKEKTEWHRIVVVKIIEQYVKKGSNVFLEGQLQTRKWEDKEGIEKYTTEVVLQGFNSTFKMLDSKGASLSEDFGKEKSIQNTEDSSSEIDDDIPF